MVFRIRGGADDEELILNIYNNKQFDEQIVVDNCLFDDLLDMLNRKYPNSNGISIMKGKKTLTRNKPLAAGEYDVYISTTSTASGSIISCVIVCLCE